MEKKFTDTYVEVPLWVKIVALSIPVALFLYIIGTNFVFSQEFNYFYDIGSQQDKLNPYIEPIDRTSNINYGINEDYRDINHKLIYFSIPYIKGSEKVETTIRFRADNKSRLILGIKNNSGWNYTWEEMNINYNGGWALAKELSSLEKVYYENNKLSISINFPEMVIQPNATYSIDWINITVYKPGLLK